MRMKLMVDGRVAAKLDIRFGCMSLAVLEVDVIDPELLPPGIRIPIRAGRVSSLQSATEVWLRDRQIPDYRKGLDELMIQAYQVDAYRMGRMCKTQHTAAALSYYVSGTDRYYLTPEKMESICYVLEDFAFSALYLLPPCTSEMADAIRHRKIAAPAGKKIVPGIWGKASPDYTVPSAYPSWWEWEGERKYLVQQPGKKALEVYRHVLMPLLPSMEDAGTVRFDFSGLGDDILWLSNLIPYLMKGDIWEQVADLLQEVSGSCDVLAVLQECERAAEECGGVIAWNEMGISCGKNKAKPVVIL